MREEHAQSPSMLGEILVDQGVIKPEALDRALTHQQHQQKVASELQKDVAASTIMVASANLDHLIDLVGDLITAQSRVSSLANTRGNQELITTIRGIEQQTHRIRNTTMHIRKMNLGCLLAHFRRLIADEAEKHSCRVDLQVEGADVEFDKTMIERLEQPLAELLSFCIRADQETVEKRRATGKQDRGTIAIRCGFRGSDIQIVIESDGCGLPGIEQNRSAEGSLFNEVEADHSVEKSPTALQIESAFRRYELDCLFDQKPVELNNHFAERIACAGIDLAAVKRAIGELHGTITATGRAGRGIRLVITVSPSLAVIQGLLVGIADQKFILPLSVIQECVDRPIESSDSDTGTGLVRIREKLVPYVSLRKLLGIDGELPPTENIVVAEVERHRIGFAVDMVIDEIQTVVKPLGRFLRQASWIQGAAILGDGHIAMILKLTKLLGAIPRLSGFGRVS
jgi:two-component system chemotaxis sensor kinase CheA